MSDKIQESEEELKPSFIHAFATFGLCVSTIGIGLFYLEVSLHSLMLVCLVITSISAWRLSKNGFKPIRYAMNEGISKAFSAIYIFILIGAMIAAFILSGTVGTLIYYGLQIISPEVLLPAGLIFCSAMSLATGTSWGTVATAGMVLMGVGTSMNIPAPIIAGMVVSGACFGDKMSPVSDTTNLSAMSSEVNIYDHIKSMAYTTGPAYLISLALFGVLGVQYASNTVPEQQIIALMDGLNNLYDISFINLLPIIVMLTLSCRRVSAEPAMMISIIVAVVLAIFIQERSVTDILNAIYSGDTVDSGIEYLNNLLSRGGIASMMWTLSLCIMALSLGGVLSKFNFINVLIEGFLQRVKRAGSLVFVTIASCLLGNVSMGEAYMSIILGGKLFGPAYDEIGVDRRVLSRSLEEGGTLTSPLIPWTTAGAFFSTALGVQTIDYIGWSFLNLLNPVLSIIFAYLGWAVFSKKKNSSSVKKEEVNYE
ncbi:Na(+)/H(+) antiporter NhaC (plasmid) [Vibrio scophthalmi]|uniref:Na+/H+ antiporter NhaC n=1 Tax=Vibrio scophthalmi TaxID=45658 RepID=UPI000809827C|nr:Na+/H+ antiporter NhaC [Vibrio scophthalmi]ANS88259.1 Na(+)/H(+) antiporter NhaC [Vibrio scophthalmi]